MRKFSIFLVGLAVSLLPWLLHTPCLAVEKSADGKTKPCKAANPVPNPWTKRCPKGWWMKRHENILAAPGRKECQIVFIGDSITDGWDAEKGGKKVWDREYVPLGALNLGINCDSTQHALWRLDHGEIDGLPKLKVAVIEIGTNNVGITRDPPEDIAKGVEAICKRLKQKAPQARILLMAIFPKRFGAIRHEVANNLIAKLADGKRIFFMDINDTLVKEKVIADRVGHLTEKGYEIWARKMRPTLKKLMQNKTGNRVIPATKPAKGGIPPKRRPAKKRLIRKDFKTVDFASAARDVGVDRIIYPGGLFTTVYKTGRCPAGLTRRAHQRRLVRLTE